MNQIKNKIKFVIIKHRYQLYPSVLKAIWNLCTSHKIRFFRSDLRYFSVLLFLEMSLWIRESESHLKWLVSVGRYAISGGEQPESRVAITASTILNRKEKGRLWAHDHRSGTSLSGWRGLSLFLVSSCAQMLKSFSIFPRCVTVVEKNTQQLSPRTRKRIVRVSVQIEINWFQGWVAKHVDRCPVSKLGSYVLSSDSIFMLL